jgi:hypothetical protein
VREGGKLATGPVPLVLTNSTHLAQKGIDVLVIMRTLCGWTVVTFSLGGILKKIYKLAFGVRQINIVSAGTKWSKLSIIVVLHIK